MKETELARLLLKDPEIAERQGEILAHLPFSDRSLDTLRHELLNLAASGFRLEIQALENHLVHRGMADLVARLNAGRGGDLGDVPSGNEDAEAQFLRAATELRKWRKSGLNASVPPSATAPRARRKAGAEYSRLKGLSND